MAIKTFTVDELEDLDVSWSHILKEGLGAGRWSEVFVEVFEYKGKYYLVNIEEGLTEYQEYYDDDRYPDRHVVDGALVVDCPEVEVYEALVPTTKWRLVP